MAFIAAAVGLAPKPPPQRVPEIAVQTAKEGEPRVIVYGTVRPIGGNLITPRKLFTRQRRSNPPVIRGRYAIGVCEGPIHGFGRIWRNGKLVYDGRPGSAWGARNNGAFLRDFRLYLGGWSQNPDPLLQAAFGAALIPSFRGTAYMMAGRRYEGEDLSDTGGAVPQWQFEVFRAYNYTLTSRPYPVMSDDTATLAPSVELLVVGGLVEYDAGSDSADLTPEAVRLDLSPVIDDTDAATLSPEADRLSLSSLVVDTDTATLAPATERLALSLLNDRAIDTATLTPTIEELTLYD